MDPTNLDACRQYAQYRHGLRSANRDEDLWTDERVRKEVYATLLKAYVIQVRDPLLRIQICLLSSSSFRLDLSSHYVVITKEDSQAPGMRCDKDTYFYQAYLDDLVLTSKQGKMLPNAPDAFNPNALTASTVRNLFSEVGLDIHGLEDESLVDIIGMVASPKNPYA